jgi:hypothetical protein
VAEVELGAYHVTYSQPEQIDIIINGVVRATVNASLDVDVTVVRFSGVVRGGRLVSALAHKSDVSGSLTLDSINVLRARLEFDLSATVPLGTGVALL